MTSLVPTKTHDSDSSIKVNPWVLGTKLCAWQKVLEMKDTTWVTKEKQKIRVAIRSALNLPCGLSGPSVEWG